MYWDVLLTDFSMFEALVYVRSLMRYVVFVDAVICAVGAHTMLCLSYYCYAVVFFL